MACCKERTNYPPIPQLKIEERLHSTALQLKADWWDNSPHADCRSAAWTLFVNENEVLTLPFAGLDSPINIGIGSTNEEWILPNGTEDIISYLENMGNDIEDGDSISIEAHVINCRGIQSENPAIFEFAYSADPDWQTVLGESWMTLDEQPFEHC